MFDFEEPNEFLEELLEEEDIENEPSSPNEVTETLGAMLPQIPLSESTIEYILNPEYTMNDYFSESIFHDAANIVTYPFRKLRVSVKTRNLIMKIAIQEKRIEVASKKKRYEKMLPKLKQELIHYKEELAKIYNSSDDASKKDINIFRKQAKEKVDAENKNDVQGSEGKSMNTTTESVSLEIESAVQDNSRLSFFYSVLSESTEEKENKEKQIEAESDVSEIEKLKKEVKSLDKKIDVLKKKIKEEENKQTEEVQPPVEPVPEDQPAPEPQPPVEVNEPKDKQNTKDLPPAPEGEQPPVEPVPEVQPAPEPQPPVEGKELNAKPKNIPAPKDLPQAPEDFPPEEMKNNNSGNVKQESTIDKETWKKIDKDLLDQIRNTRNPELIRELRKERTKNFTKYFKNKGNLNYNNYQESVIEEDNDITLETIDNFIIECFEEFMD